MDGLFARPRSRGKGFRISFGTKQISSNTQGVAFQKISGMLIIRYTSYNPMKMKIRNFKISSSWFLNCWYPSSASCLTSLMINCVSSVPPITVLHPSRKPSWTWPQQKWMRSKFRNPIRLIGVMKRRELFVAKITTMIIAGDLESETAIIIEKANN